MTNRVVKILLILAAASTGVALFGLFLDDWNAVFAVIGGAGAAVTFLVAAGVAKLVGDSAPRKVTSLGSLGSISIIIGLATWLFETWITQGGEGRFIFPLPFLYLPLLMIGVALVVVGAINKQK